MRRGRDRGPAASAAAALFAILAGAAACDGQKTVAPITVERGTWSAIRTEIIDTSCAFASCHGGARPAAGLDLSLVSACRDLVGRPSCLFPQQVLVNPARPEESFLMNKLTGEGLTTKPKVVCGTGTNLRMPFGAPPLNARQLAIVSSWIAAGADCEDGLSPDAGADGGAMDAFGFVADGAATEDGGAHDGGPVVVVSAAPARLMVVAGVRAELAVTLSRPSPSGGTAVTVSISDGTIAGVPANIIVPAGEITVALAVIGKRPGTTRVRVAADPSQEAAGTDVVVTGLALNEVLVAGADVAAGASWLEVANVSQAPIDLGDYRMGVGVNAFAGTTAALTGVLGPGGCFVVGGPQSGSGNGSPIYAQVWNLASVFFGSARPPGQSFAVGLFDGAADLSFAGVLPIDAVAFGGVGDTGLLGADGQALSPVGTVPAAGRSLRRTGPATWREERAPSPGNCSSPAP